MGISPAVAFTTVLLALMVGAGVVSSSWGYALGRQALTGSGSRMPDRPVALPLIRRRQRRATAQCCVTSKKLFKRPSYECRVVRLMTVS